MEEGEIRRGRWRRRRLERGRSMRSRWRGKYEGVGGGG